MLRLILAFGMILVGFLNIWRGPVFALWFYLWFAYFRPESWVWTNYISQLNLSLIVGFVLLITALPRLRAFRWSWLMGLTGLFFAQSIVSLVATEHWDVSFPSWIDFLKVFLVTTIMTFVVTDLATYRKTIIVIAYSLGFEAVKQGWAQLVLNPGGVNNNTHPALGDNNGVAVGMMMLVPLFIALAQTSSGRREQYVHRFFVIGAFYRGISTYSRGGFLAALTLGLAAFWRSPKKMRALLGIGVLVALIVPVLPTQFWDRMQTITAPVEERDSSAQGRLYYWSIATRMANAKPLTGVGFNGFKPSFLSYDTSGGAWGSDRAVHSAWFGVLAEMGYPGLIFFVLVVSMAILTSRQVRRRARGRPDGPALAAYASALQMSFVAYAVGDTFLHGQYTELFWHLIGMNIALQNIAASPPAIQHPMGPTGTGHPAPLSQPASGPGASRVGLARR